MRITQTQLQKLIREELALLSESPDDADIDVDMDPKALAEERTLEELRVALRLYWDPVEDAPDIVDGLNKMRRELTYVIYDLKSKDLKIPVKELIVAIEKLDDTFEDVQEILARRAHG